MAAALCTVALFSHVVVIPSCLHARIYQLWPGSTVDAMSLAIEGADVFLYGISRAYKESTNCRLEAN